MKANSSLKGLSEEEIRNLALMGQVCEWAIFGPGQFTGSPYVLRILVRGDSFQVIGVEAVEADLLIDRATEPEQPTRVKRRTDYCG